MALLASLRGEEMPAARFTRRGVLGAPTAHAPVQRDVFARLDCWLKP